MEEIFKPINGYEGLYEISNTGKIKGLRVHGIMKDNIFMKPLVDTKGYLSIDLRKNSKPKRTRIHRLVAEHFIENINGSLYVDHIDCNTKNNDASNLRWCTHRQNCTYNAQKKKENYSSKHIGVYYNKKAKKFQSSIIINGKKVYLGCFENEEEAGSAYQNKLKEIS